MFLETLDLGLVSDSCNDNLTPCIFSIREIILFHLLTSLGFSGMIILIAAILAIGIILSPISLMVFLIYYITNGRKH